MAFEAKTIDEEVAGISDSYDAFIAPKTIWRNNNNKLYLIFKSIGAGFSKIRDTVLALKYRFDPRFCDEDDLESAMLITGETRITGKSSMLRVIVTNTSGDTPAVLGSGTYLFTSVDGEVFSFTAQTATTIAPLGFDVLLFYSRNEGSWPVQTAASAPVVREDGTAVDALLTFEVYDNSGALGRPAESMFELRQRLLTDTRRQDSLHEIELALKALPNIFECNLIFNQSESEPYTIEDGTVLAPKELLVILTGAPNQDVADVIMSHTVYKTHMNTMDEVLWYNNVLFAGGRYPVYFMFHKKEQFYLTINYRYDPQKLLEPAINAAFETLLRKYRTMTTHIDEITEPLLYRDVQDHDLPGVELKKIYLQIMSNGDLESVAVVPIPRLKIPELTGSINFIAEPLRKGDGTDEEQ